MSESERGRNFSQSQAKIDEAFALEGRGGFKKAIKEHGEESIARRKAMVSNLKDLCAQKNITNRDQLTKKTLQQFMLDYPDKFFGLKSADGVLNHYFMNTLSTLKDLVFGEEE